MGRIKPTINLLLYDDYRYSNEGWKRLDRMFGSQMELVRYCQKVPNLILYDFLGSAIAMRSTNTGSIVNCDTIKVTDTVYKYILSEMKLQGLHEDIIYFTYDGPCIAFLGDTAEREYKIVSEGDWPIYMDHMKEQYQSKERIEKSQRYLKSINIKNQHKDRLMRNIGPIEWPNNLIDNDD
jgi:hypothetical protein